MIDLSKRQFKIYVQQLLDWIDGKFTAVASSIDFTTVNNKIDAVGGKVDTVSNKIDNLPQPDLSTVAKQGTNPNATNTAILAAFGNIDFSTLAKQGTNPAATNTAILAAFGNIDFSTLAKQGTNSEATNTAILAAFNTIDFSSLATKTGQEAAVADLLILKQRIGEATDTASAQTLFGKIAAVIAAVGNIDFSALAHETSVKSGNTTTIGELTNASYGLSALKQAVTTVQDREGTAPVGSTHTTVFQYLAAILDNIEGQGGEDIPEGLGDRINLLLQFFGLPQSLPSGYHEMEDTEVLEIADEVWDAMYGFVAVPNTVHTVDGGGSERVFTTYMNPTKTYADYGWPALWDAQGETIALTDHPTAGRVIYTFNPNND